VSAWDDLANLPARTGEDVDDVAMAYEGDGRLPVIYVRGFAGSKVDEIVDDPFYGFSQGSVDVRVDELGEPRFHQFESPMLRLMSDERYGLRVQGDQRAYLTAQPDGGIDAATIWVHRFYDVASTTLARHPEDFSIERAAEDLFKLIKLVLAKTGAPRVFLVAHSMGGLICRSLVQRVIPDDPIAGGTLDAGTSYVERIFTYATPHGGIEFAIGGGTLEKVRDATGVQGADIFGPDRMYEYLTPAVPGAPGRAAFDPRVMPADGFPVDRMFCLVGTNAEDYPVAHGWSSRVVGARSDGLVQIDNAYVEGAHRALVHRSHSGRRGIVNSEEGYQNLRRFLFGDLLVHAELTGVDVIGDQDDDLVWQLETTLAIRGLPVLVHEQTAGHHCPIQIERRVVTDSTDTPLPLLTTFLSSTILRPEDPETGRPLETLRHALKLRLLSVRTRDGRFFFRDHLEQTEDWQDVLVVDIVPAAVAGELPDAWATWNSTIPRAVRSWVARAEDKLEDLAPEVPDFWRGSIRLPAVVRPLLGERAAVQVTVTPRPTITAS